MSNDLTLQLRLYGKPARFVDGSYAPGAGCYSLHCEAADRIDELEAESKRRLDALELAWGLIANAWGGDRPDSVWCDAAARWRDESWHPELREATDDE